MKVYSPSIPHFQKVFSCPKLANRVASFLDSESIVNIMQSSKFCNKAFKNCAALYESSSLFRTRLYLRKFGVFDSNNTELLLVIQSLDKLHLKFKRILSKLENILKITFNLAINIYLLLLCFRGEELFEVSDILLNAPLLVLVAVSTCIIMLKITLEYNFTKQFIKVCHSSRVFKSPTCMKILKQQHLNISYSSTFRLADFFVFFIWPCCFKFWFDTPSSAMNTLILGSSMAFGLTYILDLCRICLNLLSSKPRSVFYSSFASRKGVNYKMTDSSSEFEKKSLYLHFLSKLTFNLLSVLFFALWGGKIDETFSFSYFYLFIPYYLGLLFLCAYLIVFYLLERQKGRNILYVSLLTVFFFFSALFLGIAVPLRLDSTWEINALYLYLTFSSQQFLYFSHTIMFSYFNRTLNLFKNALTSVEYYFLSSTLSSRSLSWSSLYINFL